MVDDVRHLYHASKPLRKQNFSYNEDPFYQICRIDYDMMRRKNFEVRILKLKIYEFPQLCEG